MLRKWEELKQNVNSVSLKDVECLGDFFLNFL
jgi:hypothetical protein